MIGIAKLFIWILCAFLQFHMMQINATGITLLLATLILSSLPIILRSDMLHSKGVSAIIRVSWDIYLILGFFFPILRCYLPLAMMDAVGLRWGIPITLGIIHLMLEFTTVNSFSRGGFLLFLCTITVLLQYMITQNQTLSENLKKLRDHSKEHELLIEEKNRRLMEAQDHELYTATLKERNRIAREIHDNVGHMLTRSILQVGALRAINTSEAMKEPLDALLETLNTAMTNIRSSVHDLHDESIDLLCAVHEIIDPVESVSMHLDYDMSIHVPKNIKYCFISITKEAVNNMLKHSNATDMHIIMREHPAFYQLLIQDNGTNISLHHTDGIGLTNMKDRVKSLHGNIRITTEQGFQILISIIKTESESD